MIIELHKNKKPTEPGTYAVKLPRADKPYVTWVRLATGSELWNAKGYQGLVDGTTPLVSPLYDDAQWSVKIEFRGMAGEEDF